MAEPLLKSVSCGCGVHLIDGDGKVPRRRVVKFGEGGRAYIGCPHCNADTLIGMIACPPEPEARKSQRVKIVYFPQSKESK